MSNYSIETEVTGPLKTNCILLYDIETKEAVLFDVAGSIKKLISIIEQENLIIKYLFCTHLHFDHIMGLEEIREIFPDALLAYNNKEIDVMKNLGIFARMFGFKSSSIGKQDIEIEDNQVYEIGKIKLKTILSPGHTPGSMCFHYDDFLISGDVLFKRGIGRTDLYGGSFEELKTSIKNLFALPDKTIVYPGHGEITNIGSEKRENPFVSVADI